MLGGTTKKLGQAIGGGSGQSQDVDPKEQGNLAAGIVGKSGEILDDAGNTVGQITEGDPGSLVGNVVTATGDIVGKDGGILGKALPLGDLTGDGQPKDKEEQSGGFSVLGAAQGVKGVVDTVDGTVQTVGRTVPIVGDLTKGLGLGGGQDGGGLLGGLLGSKPEERDPQEKLEVTEDAKQDLFQDAKSEDLPIDLKDQTENVGETAKTEVETKSQPPQSEVDSKTDYTAETPDESAQKGLNEISPDDAKIPDDVKDTADVDTVKGDVNDVKDGAESAVEGAKDEAKDKLPEDADKLPEDAQDKLPEDADKLPEDAEKLPEDAKDKLPEDASVPDDAASEIKLEDKTGEAGDVADEAKSAVDDTKSKAGSDVKSKLDDIETVTVEGDILPAPFEKFEGAEIDDEGKVIFEEGSIGKVVEGDPEDVAGQEIRPDGAIVNEEGDEIGRVELKSEIAEELKEEVESLAQLKGCTVNKGGNLVNDKNEAIGRIKEGILKHMIGRKADEKGQIWNDNGVVIGQAELIPEKERSEFKDPSPFEDFPDATVQSNGEVTSDGEIIGRVIEGDAKKLKGKKVDEDGDILDRQGNVLGKAERWEPEPEAEPEPEPEVDNSILAGKRVNKAGYVVDSSGTIYGRVVEGDPKRLQGRMCNKKGEILSESGDVLGRAELVPEGEREGFKEGPFADLEGCTVARDGTVVTPSGDVVGRLTQGDGKVLFGRAVDEDGDVLDRNGNQIGKAERWEPEPEPEKKKGPMAGRRVNKKGEVYDEDGNLIGKLTSGDLQICSGKEIDDDNDVVDSKGRTVGGVSLIEDIPEPEPEPEGPTEEEKKAKEQAEADEKLAKSLGGMIEQGLDKIRPICKMITERIEKAERTPKDELDEEELVKNVKPLIEEGGKILTELNGSIRALDPDGRIQKNAKHKSNTREATPAEYHLADVLKELTGTVTTTIDNAKRKIEDMPKAKKELNPLWGLLTEPLGQILAAVGLLLTGVLNLVGRLLNGLGLGGIVDGLLGTLGLNRLLDSLGVGSLTGALTGRNQKKKSGGGLLG